MSALANGAWNGGLAPDVNCDVLIVGFLAIREQLANRGLYQSPAVGLAVYSSIADFECYIFRGDSRHRDRGSSRRKRGDDLPCLVRRVRVGLILPRGCNESPCDDAEKRHGDHASDKHHHGRYLPK